MSIQIFWPIPLVYAKQYLNDFSLDVDGYAYHGYPETVAWAHGSLAELYLMLPAYSPKEVKRLMLMTLGELKRMQLCAIPRS